MRLLRFVSVALAVVILGATAYAVAARLSYPFELEWIEGATLVQVARLLAGEPIYVEPSLAFVPLAYPPLYYYACAPVAWLAGGGFVPLRLVSIAATIVTLSAVFVIVRRTSGAAAALTACGAFAGAYRLSDGWFDLARVDALYVALLALVYATALRARTGRQWAIAGALAFLALMTKQPALLSVAPLGLYLLITDRRAAWWFGGTLAALTGLSFLAMNLWTGGWFGYYVFELPRLRLTVSMRPERLLTFWIADLAPLAPALVVGLTVILVKREWRHAAIASGFILSAWMSRLEGGAWNNTVLPAWLALAVLLGMSLRPDLGHAAGRTALAVAQLLLLVYNPRPFVPDAQQRADGQAFVQSLRSMAPPVLIIDHASWATLAELPEFAHGWAVTDVLWADRGDTGRRLEAEIRQALKDRRFGTILLDDERTWFFRDIEAHYARRGEVRAAPVPLSGAPRRPRYVYE